MEGSHLTQIMSVQGIWKRVMGSAISENVSWVAEVIHERLRMVSVAGVAQQIERWEQASPSSGLEALWG